MAKGKKPEPQGELKIKLPVFVMDGQDGSISIHVFKSIKDAERAAESLDLRFEDDVQLLEVTVDSNGKVTDGFEDLEEFMSDYGLEDDEFDSDSDEDSLDFDEDSDEDIVDED
jgi:hypothetical protein